MVWGIVALLVLGTYFRLFKLGFEADWSMEMADPWLS